MLPFPIKPMLLQVKEKAFNDANFLFEPKMDGHRGIMFYENKNVRLHSKNGREGTSQYPELHSPLIHANEAVLDGEVCVLIDGRPSLEDVLDRYNASSKYVPRLSQSKPAVYIVWDILWLDGQPVHNLALLQRKQILEQVLEDSVRVTKITYIQEDGLAMWDAVKYQKLEGMTCKPVSAPYLFGKRAWYKVKDWHQATVMVMGYSQKENTVLVGNGEKVLGTAIGLRGLDRGILFKLLEEYGRKGKSGSVIWLPPGVYSTVKYTTISPRGNYRDCTWLAFTLPI